MGSIYDDLEGHEGYAARRLADGTLTATWTSATASFRSYVAACNCGWNGGEHPPTEHGHEAAIDEWDVRHAQPLLAQAVPRELKDMIGEVKLAVSELVADRPAAGTRVLHELSTWAAATVERTRSESRGASMRAAREGSTRRPKGRTLRL